MSRQVRGHDPDRWAGYHVSELTLARILADRRRDAGDKVFLTYAPDDRRITYAEADEISDRLASGLLALGIGRGAHVAVVMENSPEVVLLHFALAKSGAVHVAINPAAGEEAMATMLVQADVQTVICDSGCVGHVAAVLAQADQVALLITVGGAGEAAGPAGLRVARYEDLVQHPAVGIPFAVRFSDPSCIMFTSGTTGPPKPVTFTHAGGLLWERSSQELYGVGPEDCLYVCLPLFHAAALHGMVQLAVAVGASIVLARQFDVANFWADISKHEATISMLLGAMTHFVWSEPPGASDAKHSLRFLHAGPIQTRFAREFEARFNVPLVCSYGLTDYGVPVRFGLSDPPEKFGSAGRAMPGWSLRIVDPYDFAVPTGMRGEIVLSNRQAWHTACGYYGMPDATVLSRRNGWFHTGDLGYLDDDGFLWFVDRQADSIHRVGEEISTFEIEQVLLALDEVADAAVFAIHGAAEDDVAAAIVMREGHAWRPAEIIARCRGRLPQSALPRFLWSQPVLPRNSSQRVEKYKLRDILGNRDAVWDRASESPGDE